MEWSHLDEEILAAVMPSTFLEAQTDESVQGYGAGRYNQIEGVEPGPPPATGFRNSGPSPV